MDLYNRKTGQIDHAAYMDLRPVEKQIDAIFHKMVGAGYAPADVTLFIAEAASASRMEFVLSGGSKAIRPCPHCQAPYDASNATMGGCWNCGKKP
jgi:hypothetical protein